MAWAEERMYPRYQCAGEARLQRVGSTAAARARVLNVCLGGCLLSFDTPPGLVTGDDLELKIEINETRFQARGWVVEGLNQEQHAGIIFASMAEEDRESLNLLVRQLDRALRSVSVGS